MTVEQQKKYNYWQWRTLIVLMLGYAFYYFVRKNFSVVMPALEAELGITKVQLGLFLTLNGIIYGLSRFANGFLADRFSRRKLMSAGLFLSAAANFFICFSPAMDSFVDVLDTEGKATLALVYVIGSVWVLNGYFQGMGVPPCMSLMAHWIKPQELATKQSVWNASHSIGAGLISVICAFILDHYGYSAWQMCFAVPASIAVVGAFVLLFALKDTPSSVGLPELEDMDDAAASPAEQKKETELTGAAFKRFISRLVFRNPLIWILAVSNFCIYVVRFTILDWGATFLTQYKGMEISHAGSVVAASEIIGGIAGMLIAGWFTDRFMKSRAHRTCLFCTIGATVSFFLFWKTPDMNWLASVFLCLSSFFVYGPQALLGIAASNQATKHACATANGILGVFGYASTTVSGLGFGYLAQHFGWNSVFMVSVIVGVIGSVVIATMWKAKADGYEKAEEILQEIDRENLR